MKYGLFISTAILCSCLQGSSTQDNQQNMDSIFISDQARELAHKLILTDGHIDVPHRLNALMEDVGDRTQHGDFDFVRAREGGLDAPFMSIYVPASYQENGGAREFAEKMITLVEDMVNKHPDKFAIARSPQEIQALFEQGKIALPMGMENGAPLGDDLNNVEYFYQRGIRYITLTHSRDNLICDSSYDTTRTWNGLSDFGRRVVAEMNRVGIMADISHVSDSAFYQVMEISKAPAIASHSSCRHFTPGWERNMSDDMIKTLAANGGVIQINFGSSFLDQASRESSDSINQYLTKWESDQSGLSQTEIDQFKKSYYRKHFVYSDVSRVADHIDHVVAIAGIDHVGLGSDYDGVGDTLPTGLKDVSQYPNLISELLRRGYSEVEIARICYKNVFRVWDKVTEVAQELQMAN